MVFEGKQISTEFISNCKAFVLKTMTDGCKEKLFLFFTSKVKVGAALVDYTVGLLLHLYTAELSKGMSYVL